MTTYNFSLAHPPLLKDFKGNVFEVPTSALMKLFGEYKWSSEDRQVGYMPGSKMHIDYHIKHIREWVISQNPYRFATSTEKTVTETTGFAQSQKTAMCKSLCVSASASCFGFSTEVQATLEINTEEYSEEHYEKTISETRTFEKDYSYCTWELKDFLKLEYHAVIKLGSSSPWTSGVSRYNTIENIISTYEDGWHDPKAVAIENFVETLDKEKPKLFSNPLLVEY